MRTLLAICILCSATAFGQGRVNVASDDINMQLGTFFQAVNGVPLNTNTFYKVVEGSPFFMEHWMKGAASLGEKEYKNLRLKLNLMDDKVHFMDAKGNEIICSTPINSVSLTDSLTGKQYRFVHGSNIPSTQDTRSAWMELVTDGAKAQLYCHHKKNISETRPYGSATLEQRILTSDLYYVRVGDKLVRVKKLSDIISALDSKQEEAQQWSKKNAKDNAAGYAKLVEWYNAQFK